MKVTRYLNLVVTTLLLALCAIVILKFLRALRYILPWRVNCWFCNHNFWIKFPDRNCWTCSNCEQYNGFTRDGDYNKQFHSPNNKVPKVTKPSYYSPPCNGLCKMCNINQQLKIAQLANFVPMNEKNFDKEIDLYRVHLEKAYKLCSPCKKVLQLKLHKEKETLLGSKLLESRTPEKIKYIKKEKQNILFKKTLNKAFKITIYLLFISIILECILSLSKEENLSKSMKNLKEVLKTLSEKMYMIIEMKLLSVPWIKTYFNDISNLLLDIPRDQISVVKSFDELNILTQEMLGCIACLIQIVRHVSKIDKLKYAFIPDLLLVVFLATFTAHNYIQSAAICLTKVTCLSVAMIIMNRGTLKSSKSGVILQTSAKKLKNLVKPKNQSTISTDSSLDTDDDVSLSKFGLHNISDSSNELTSPINKSISNGRSFTPRMHDSSLWSKSKLNSSFSLNSTLKSPSSVSETVFVKPSFNKYHNLANDSDSDLDESINSLCIGSHSNKSKNKTNSIFSLRKFNATPAFSVPIECNRPLISPSKLGHSASWVAGGYWGSEGERQLFNLNGSRSSSQSSGFESQASSLTQRNVFSQPPSRGESLYGESDRSSILLDRFQNCNMFCPPQNFSRVSSPIYPQMQYNSHVHIPQPRFPQSHNSFNTAQQNVFQSSGRPSLKLPRMNSFASH